MHAAAVRRHTRDRLEQFGAPRAHKSRESDDLARANLERHRDSPLMRAHHGLDAQPHRAARTSSAPFLANNLAPDHQSLHRRAVVLAARQLASGAAIAQHDHPIGDAHDLLEMMRHEDDGNSATAQFVHDPEQPIGFGRGEARGRLVENQHARLAGKRLGNFN